MHFCHINQSIKMLSRGNINLIHFLLNVILQSSFHLIKIILNAASIFYKALQIYSFFKDGTCVHLLKLTQAVKSSVQVRHDLHKSYYSRAEHFDGWTRFYTVNPVTLTSIEFIECSILNFLMMECCRYFLVDYMGAL